MSVHKTRAAMLTIVLLSIWTSPAAAHDGVDVFPILSGKVSLAVSAGLAGLTLGIIWQRVGSYLSWLHYGLIGLVIITAVVHLIEGTAEFILLLNGLGYLALLGALFLPVDFLTPYRQTLKWGLLGYTLLTFVLYFVTHFSKLATNSSFDYSALIIKAVEMIIILILLVALNTGKNLPSVMAS